jgi:hypothetical protein
MCGFVRADLRLSPEVSRVCERIINIKEKTKERE